MQPNRWSETKRQSKQETQSDCRSDLKSHTSNRTKTIISAIYKTISLLNVLSPNIHQIEIHFSASS